MGRQTFRRCVAVHAITLAVAAGIQGDPREPDIFWMSSIQKCAEEEQTVPMCGFNKMVPQRTLQTIQWPLFETCSPGTSFPVSETCRGSLVLPVFQRVIFFLWGYLKSRVYTHKSRTLNDLEEAILQEIRPIDRHLLARVMDDFKKRLENCIQEDGRHLTDIVFTT